MDIGNIIEAYCNSATKPRETDVKRWYSKICDLSGAESLENSLKSRDFLLRCFATTGTNTISRTQYYSVKEILAYILERLGIDKENIPSREEIIEFSEMRCYFADIASVISFIDEVGLRMIDGYNPKNGLVRLKSIAILSWYGYSTQEIAEFLNSYIKFDGVPYLQKNDERLDLTEEEYHILSLQAESTSITTLPKGKTYSYKYNTDYLIKNRSGNPLNCGDNVSKLVEYFNTAANDTRLLSCKGLKLSGIFERIYTDNSSDTIIEKIQRHEKCQRNFAYGRKIIYLKWLKKFHNSEV